MNPERCIRGKWGKAKRFFFENGMIFRIVFCLIMACTLYAPLSRSSLLSIKLTLCAALQACHYWRYFLGCGRQFSPHKLDVHFQGLC